jgi:hypothetical protein
MPTTFAPWAATDRHGAHIVRSPDGVLVVTMQRVRGGVFVERAVQRLGAARVVQAIVFHSASSLHRWCDADVARFDYPLLFSKLRHDADELFDCHADASLAG